MFTAEHHRALEERRYCAGSRGDTSPSLRDALGSTLALTDSTGTQQTSYSFKPFGNTTLSGLATNNSFAYTGRELDATGLYFHRARYYNPTLQRFISEDPLRFRVNSVNFYEYTHDDPANQRDPSGMQTVLVEPPAAVGPADGFRRHSEFSDGCPRE